MVVEVNQEAVAGAHRRQYYRPKKNLPKNQHYPPRERLGQ